MPPSTSRGEQPTVAAETKRKQQLRHPSSPPQQQGRQPPDQRETGASTASEPKALHSVLAATLGNQDWQGRTTNTESLSLASRAAAEGPLSQRAFPTLQVPAGSARPPRQFFMPSYGWGVSSNAPDESLMNFTGVNGFGTAPQEGRNAFDSWAIGNAAAAAAAAGIPHILIGVVLADGSVWGIDDLRGSLVHALHSSALLQQSSLSTGALQQQQITLLPQHQLLREMQGQPADSFENRRRLHSVESQATQNPLSRGVSASPSFEQVNLSVLYPGQLHQQQHMQQQPQQQHLLLLQQRRRLLQQQLLMQQQQRRLQQQRQKQQRCLALAGPHDMHKCIAGEGANATVAVAALATEHGRLAAPAGNWRVSRQQVSYVLDVTTAEGGTEEVEVTPEELSRLLKGAQLMLEPETSTNDHQSNTNKEPENSHDIDDHQQQQQGQQKPQQRQHQQQVSAPVGPYTVSLPPSQLQKPDSAVRSEAELHSPLSKEASGALKGQRSALSKATVDSPSASSTAGGPSMSSQT